MTTSVSLVSSITCSKLTRELVSPSEEPRSPGAGCPPPTVQVLERDVEGVVRLVVPPACVMRIAREASRDRR
jgi:hypothetical protein